MHQKHDFINTHPSENPPAFPGARGIDQHAGISLRDYLAAAALQGILSNPKRLWCSPENYADDAYRCADAMLKERLKP